MGLVTGIIVYLLTWWLVLFAVLPIGVEPEENPDAAHMSGAPKDPKIKKKFIATTLISAFVWIIIYILIEADIVNLYDIAQHMAEEDTG
jgi:predicted secreted protein